MEIMEPGYKMLGSTGTQYLNPDYIQPLPTTLDSKNSPLALLAQTCSSIGKDCGSTPKLSLPSLTDKKDQRDNGLLGGGGAKDASSSSSSSSSSSRHRSTSDSPLIGSSSGGGGGACGSSRSGEGTRSNRTGGKSSNKDCSSSRSSSSDAGGGGGRVMGDENSPKARGVHSSSRPLSSFVSTGSGGGSDRCTPSSAVVTGGSVHRDFVSLRGGGSGGASAASCSSGLSLLPSASAINNGKLMVGGESSLLFDSYPEEILRTSAAFLHQQQQSLQEALRLQHEGLQSLQAGLGPLPSAYPPLLFGHPLAAALDPLMYSYSASLAAVHGLAMNSHKLPTLSPYLGYARVSTAGGGSTLVPVCKDPYCTTGSIPPPPPSLQSPASGSGGGGTSCGSGGCSQCCSGGGHDKTPRCTGLRSAANGSLGGGGGDGQFSSPLYPLSLPSAGGGGGGGLVNPLLGMAAAAQLGVGLTPYACSWLSGGEFCGKRFSKADDLLQHLRTHASSGDAALPAFALPPPGIPLPTPGFGAGHPFSIPGSSSSSLSPGSLLQQAAAAAAAAAGQAYPRCLSPTAALLNASRYHPYKSPFAAVLPTASSSASSSSTGASSGGLLGVTGSASALDAYYSSPYALFGHRIGAAAVGP